MRHYEVMVILDPSLDERTVAPSLEAFLNVVKTDGGTVDKVDIWVSVVLPIRSPSTPRASTR
jgi:small subunit ribosomal protein S6